MAEQGDSTRAIDETPISPSRPNAARKNSLEYHLSHRPERQELVDSMSLWVVSPANFPAFNPRAWLTMWSLSPENILPASTAAPGLQAHQKEVSNHPAKVPRARPGPGTAVHQDRPG